jgi:hypothetical protein
MVLMDSSEITSKPPVAAIIRSTPKSNRSSFFNSVVDGDSLFPSFWILLTPFETLEG